jgi:hypothetical protein
VKSGGGPPKPQVKRHDRIRPYIIKLMIFARIIIMMMYMSDDEDRTRELADRARIMARYGTDQERKDLIEYGARIGAAEAVARVAADASVSWMAGQQAPRTEITDLQTALSLIRPAGAEVERAELRIIGHARAAGLRWPEINMLLGYGEDHLGRQANTRYKRLRERYPDVRLPGPGNLILSLYGSEGEGLRARLVADASSTPALVATVFTETADPILAILHRPYRPEVVLARAGLYDDQDRQQFAAALKDGPSALIRRYAPEPGDPDYDGPADVTPTRGSDGELYIDGRPI